MNEIRPALLFPGQGSQRPGMGADLLGIPAAAKVFACASDVFGFDVGALCCAANAETINGARNAQVAIATTSIAISEVLREGGVAPSVLLGFSLGQISALAVSGMLSIEETFRLLDVRAHCMAVAAEDIPGAMCALMGADESSAQALCRECAADEVLVIANYNCPGQIVISGNLAAIERAEIAWKGQSKRCIRLATAGAFHSPLMARAARVFLDYLASCTFAEPHTLILCNTDAAPLVAAGARTRLADHLTHPVRFSQSVDVARCLGARVFLEVGCGGVLTNLVRRIDKGSERGKVEGAAGLQTAIAAYGCKPNAR
ncbi:MAG: ACP S-malonyltransferase [Raoultibacter sp.]